MGEEARLILFWSAQLLVYVAQRRISVAHSCTACRESALHSAQLRIMRCARIHHSASDVGASNKCLRYIGRGEDESERRQLQLQARRRYTINIAPRAGPSPWLPIRVQVTRPVRKIRFLVRCREPPPKEVRFQVTPASAVYCVNWGCVRCTADVIYDSKFA